MNERARVFLRKKGEGNGVGTGLEFNYSKGCEPTNDREEEETN